MKTLLSEAETPIRGALERLAESPRELRCFVVIKDDLMGRFVQFCTPPPPSPFFGSDRIQSDEPLIYDGTGNGKPGGYEMIQVSCDVDRGVRFALETLAQYLPRSAELTIIEESTQMERPS